MQIKGLRRSRLFGGVCVKLRDVSRARNATARRDAQSHSRVSWNSVRLVGEDPIHHREKILLRQYLPLEVRAFVDFAKEQFRDGPPCEQFVR